MNYKLVTIICPVFNEEDNILSFVLSINDVFSNINVVHEILFIDDGSTDKTLQVIKELKSTHSEIKYVSLSRNFGKDAALTAGLDNATGDAAIPMDVDLQDPPSLIPEMVAHWLEGYDVVLAKRVDRKDSWLKRTLATTFYSVMSRVGDRNIHHSVGDFRLLSRPVLNALMQVKEKSRYMKGLLSWVGYRTTTIDFVREERKQGESKFPLKSQIKHALDGLTNFSSLPLRFWSILGFMFSFASMIYGFFIIIYTLITGVTTPGYASIFVAITFFGGIQLISIGVLGEYIGRIYMETKSRPIYLIKEKS